MPPKTNVLVSGGAGFLGSYVCERLLEEGKHVTCLDNLSTGRMCNIEHLLDTKHFSFIEGDVCSSVPSDPAREVWNLASPASPPQYQADPVGTLMANVNGTHNLLELAHAHGARFFQASTSEVYGDPEVHPQPEDYKGSVNTFGPRACYDEGKRSAETLCFIYRERYGLDVRIARIFNTYGPRMDPKDGRVVSNFIVNALDGVPLQIYGGGSQTRSFCYYSDLIDGFFRLMRLPEMPEGPINIGNPSEFTIRELAEKVLAMTGSQAAMVDAPLPEDDPMQRRPDISKAKAKLGWEPMVDLTEGLEETIAYFGRNSVRVGLD
ncbi:MAG: SDR family oxidoreductase [Dinoroseobacter sp.]|nr:SDR family oxidoreductase [Dinoroseobacter sp.]